MDAAEIRETKMNAAEIRALAGLFSEKEVQQAGQDLEPGVHEVDFVVHVKGAVKRCENHEQRVVGGIPLWLLLGVALSKVNQATLQDVVDQAVALENSAESVKSAELKSLANQVKERADAALAEIKETTRRKVSGKTIVACQATRLNLATCPDQD